MEIAGETSTKIVDHINRILADPDPEPYVYKFEEPIDIRTIVEREHVLPMFYDWSGFYAIKTMGEIVVVEFGPPVSIRGENDARILRMILFQGIKRYPNLTELTPVRPPDAVKCFSCDGSGREPMNDTLRFEDERILCWCGGLGWVPKGEYQPTVSQPL